MKGRPVHHRVGFALAGLREAWRRESSLRSHGRTLAGAVVVLLVLRPDAVWWAAIALCATLVIGFELLNSALEGLIDLVHPDIHPEVKAAKDMAAGAVLVTGFGAMAVAACALVANADRLAALWRAVGGRW